MLPAAPLGGFGQSPPTNRPNPLAFPVGAHPCSVALPTTVVRRARCSPNRAGQMWGPLPPQVPGSHPNLPAAGTSSSAPPHHQGHSVQEWGLSFVSMSALSPTLGNLRVPLLKPALSPVVGAWWPWESFLGNKARLSMFPCCGSWWQGSRCGGTEPEGAHPPRGWDIGLEQPQPSHRRPSPGTDPRLLASQ